VPVDRSWTVPEDHQPDISWDEEGNLVLTPRVVRDDDDDALASAMIEAISILRRVGGTIQIASQRGEVAPKVVITESYIFAYNSFTPLVRRLDGDAEPHEVDDAPEADDLEQHFPDGGMSDVLADVEAEVPAPEPDAAAVE
jgi:hypothetical protein